MSTEIKRENWNSFVKELNENYHLRPVKMEVFDDCGIQTEANIVPFNGIDIDLKGENPPIINLNLGEDAPEGRHLFHNIYCVVNIYS